MKIEFVSSFPLASDSPDVLMPHGARHGSTSEDPAFRQKMHLMYGGRILRVLDLGCSGGGFVKNLIDDGDIAVGIEGSDWSKEMQRQGWNVIPKFLFVGDIAKPFQILENGKPMKFDVITSWQVFEHLKTEDLPQLIENMKNHLVPGGLYLGNIGTNEEVINGVRLHQTVQKKDWWIAEFEKHSLTYLPNIDNYFGSHYLHYSPSSGCTMALTNDVARAPEVPYERSRKKVFEKWSGSSVQKIVKRVINGIQ